MAAPLAPRVVLFDLDDTLWDLCKTMQRAHAEWASAVAALPGGEKLVETHTGSNMEWLLFTDAAASFKDIKRDQPDIAKDNVKVRREAMRQACVANGVDPAVLVEPGFQAWTSARNRPVFFEGAVEMVSRLKARGLVVGVITDGFADLESMPALNSSLDFAIFAREAGVSKPDARLFELAKSKAEGLLSTPTKAADFVMVGDSYQKDIAGARAVGMRAVWLDFPQSFSRLVLGQKVPEPPLAYDARIENVLQLEKVLFG